MAPATLEHRQAFPTPRGGGKNDPKRRRCKAPRITDHISLGVVTKTFPAETIDRILEETDRRSQRQRNLPARVMVYYVIALAFHAEASMTEVPRCLLEGSRWLARPEKDVRVSGKSGISQAWSRLGEEPVRALYR